MQSTIQVTLVCLVEPVPHRVHVLGDPGRLFLHLVYFHGGLLGLSFVTLIELRQSAHRAVEDACASRFQDLGTYGTRRSFLV